MEATGTKRFTRRLSVVYDQPRRRHVSRSLAVGRAADLGPTERRRPPGSPRGRISSQPCVDSGQILGRQCDQVDPGGPGVRGLTD